MAETVLDTLQRVSGLPRADMLEIWEQVKANHRLLDACTGPHDFSVEAQRTGTLVRRWRCTKCEGEIASVERRWYLDGLRHGQGLV